MLGAAAARAGIGALATLGALEAAAIEPIEALGTVPASALAYREAELVTLATLGALEAAARVGVATLVTRGAFGAAAASSP